MLRPGCARCVVPASVPPDPSDDGEWRCAEHGRVPVLWRPEVADYDAFVHHLAGAGAFPTLLPWPMGPDWRVSDFAWVGDGSGVLGTLTVCSGTSDLDGPVDVLVVAEEPGTGLGARVAGLATDSPPSAGEGAPVARVRIGSVSVPLWIVLLPASAVLLMRDEWILRDLSGLGPALVEMTFSGPGPLW